MARKYKQVHRKEIDFGLDEWAEVERRATACHTKTSAFIRHMAVHGEAHFYDMKDLAPLLNGLRIISNNINQIAKKANEINSIYAEDVDKLKGDMDEICRMLNTFVSTLPSTKV